MGNGWPNWWSGQHPAWAVMNAGPFDFMNLDASMMFFLSDVGTTLANELSLPKGVIWRPAWWPGMEMGLLSKEPISGLADLEGKRVRIGPGLPSEVLASTANAYTIPLIPSEIRPALEHDDLDAVEWTTVGGVLDLKLQDIANYAIVPAIWQPSVLADFLINQQNLERVADVAQRVSDSVAVPIWTIHQQGGSRKLDPEQAAIILDAEMASDLIIAINVYGNFGHRFLGRVKYPDGRITDFTPQAESMLGRYHEHRYNLSIMKGEMTIGAVEVVYNTETIDGAIHQALLIELIQVAVVSAMFILLLYWALRQSLILPMKSLQVAQQTMESLTEGVIVTDEQYNIIEVNRAFIKMTGFKTKQLIGSRARIVLPGEQNVGQFWHSVTSIKPWSGEVDVLRQDGSRFPSWLNLTETWHNGEHTGNVGVFTDIAEIKEAQNQLHHLAYFDSLTGLPNRTQLLEVLEREIQVAKRHGQKIGLLYIDLDNFKWINDRYGHDVGDLFLKEIAQCFDQRTRQSDLIFRLSGDEFTAITTDVSDEESLTILARDLISITESIKEVEGKPVSASASVGVSLYPRDAETGNLLIKQADAAMYQAKELGRNQVCFFSAELEHKRKYQHDVEQHLKHAIANNELELYYQPKVHLEKDIRSDGTSSTGYSICKIYGAECLIRWNHPERGIIPPDSFIPVANS